MNIFNEVHIPFTNPVVIFAIVLFIILLSPIVLKRFKIPGIVGLIISGMIVGPHGFNLLAMDSSVILFGTIGLLYIMFLAGVELDLNEFRKNKFHSLLFGFLVFSSSLVLGITSSYYLLHYDITASILIGAMISTYTLVSYPIVSRLGLVRHRVTVLAVGGVILTDVAALIMLVMLKSFTIQAGNFYFLLKIFVSFTAFLLVTLYVYPKVARWYFKNIEEVGTWQFIFVLALLFSAAFMAELAGFEPIIGAFAAGLALNPIIPKNSSLMDRISFFGNSIFIPFFLIQVGMIINIWVIFKGYEVLELSFILIIIIFFSKWFSAFVIQKILGYSSFERNLLFGVSLSKAAATIAIVMVGYKIGILDEKILNSSILIVLITCLVSSFFTEYYGRQVALEKESEQDSGENGAVDQKILVSLSKPETISRLIEFGIMIKEANNHQPIIALTIIGDENQLYPILSSCQKMVTQTTKEIAPKFENKIVVTSRININVSSGISKSIKENLITDIIIGLNEKNFGKNKIFGNIIQNLLEDTNQTIFAVRNNYTLSAVENLVILLPDYAEYEPGFRRTLSTLLLLARNIEAKIMICGFQKTLNYVQKYVLNKSDANQYSLHIMNDLRDYELFYEQIGTDDMLAILLSRPKSVSHNLIFENIVEELIENTTKNNLVIVYPEQNPAFIEEDISHYDILEPSPIQENIARFAAVKESIRKLFAKKDN